MRLIFYTTRNRRSQYICHAWSAALSRDGLKIEVKHESERRGVEADVAIFYGLWGSLRDAVKDYRDAGAKAIFCDLGFWGRTEPDKLNGYHRIAVNGYHATDYFQRVKHGADRFDRFGIEPQPMRRAGAHVLLAGMSAKAAWVYGLGPQEWEARAARTLAHHTRRSIWYRPKPSWDGATPIAGTEWMQAPAESTLPLHDCWAVVTHHGHSALDALIAGVPAFCDLGLASVLCPSDLSRIEAPDYPDEAARNQLLYDAAYTQYLVSEIADGVAWRYLKEEGLV